jgi:predicted SAM-dependent methyltransferase
MKLNVGCGHVSIPGYCNVDSIYMPGVDVVDDARWLKMFQHEKVEEIYACHVLEHFNRWEVHDVLRHWHDLLQPGGVLYVAVPDFRNIVHHYNKNGDLKALMGLLYGPQNYSGGDHHYCWDRWSLKKDLEKIGFVNVAEYDWKTSPFAGFDDYSKAYLPHMDKENGLLMSLNMRAEKKTIASIPYAEISG